MSKLRELGIRIGELDSGPRDSLADAGEVRVGHATIADGRRQTGVTAVIPAPGDLLEEKLPAAAVVLNGFGKTLGLVQVEELGTLESPILLTNTLNVGLVHDAAVEHALRARRAAGLGLRSYNPIVAECNDGGLNAIEERAVGRAEVFAALDGASSDFERGAVGAGRGMSCHGLKGGVGSASRSFDIGGRAFAMGALVLSNHGLLGDLVVKGVPVGAIVEERMASAAARRAQAAREADGGSVIVVLGTDLPLSDRQLRRVAARAGLGLARLGSRLAHGSGEIVLAFSTAQRVAGASPGGLSTRRQLDEELLDLPFRAASEATEAAVLDSLLSATRTVGRDGAVREALADWLDEGLLARLRA